jgi:ABC-type branched-subunit amino acid transport system ATPase component
LTPQLTVRETVLFSARLRLDALKVGSDDDKRAFVDNVLGTLELKPLSDVLVGSADEGGLSFEQKKRLSIAVELAASPSILFLDEVSTYVPRVIGQSLRMPSQHCFLATAHDWIGCSKCFIGSQASPKGC